VEAEFICFSPNLEQFMERHARLVDTDDETDLRLHTSTIGHHATQKSGLFPRRMSQLTPAA
jgi:hypothetical protein